MFKQFMVMKELSKKLITGIYTFVKMHDITTHRDITNKVRYINAVYKIYRIIFDQLVLSTIRI